MAASIFIEEGRGTVIRSHHPHPRHYAGDLRSTGQRGSSLRLFAFRAAITSTVR